jgi:hypothetical protein
LTEIAKKVQSMSRSSDSKRKRIVGFTHGADPTVVCDENGNVKIHSLFVVFFIFGFEKKKNLLYRLMNILQPK